MRRNHSSPVIFVAFLLPALASGKAAAQVAPAPGPPDTSPAPAPAAPAMPEPVETTVPAPVTMPEAGPVPAEPGAVVATSSPPSPASASQQRFGLTLGIVSLPRPIEIEGTFRVLPALAVSVQYSMLPDLTVPGGSASLRLRAFQGVARWFPFKGSFFIGSGIGFQTFRASLSSTVDDSTLTTTVDLSGMFVSPQLGWLFVWRSGFALGLTFGAQIPFPKEPVATSTYNGQPVPAEAGAGFSQDIVDKANKNKDTVRTLGRLANKYPMPNIELLRVGFFF